MSPRSARRRACGRPAAWCARSRSAPEPRLESPAHRVAVVGRRRPARARTAPGSPEVTSQTCRSCTSIDARDARPARGRAPPGRCPPAPPPGRSGPSRGPARAAERTMSAATTSDAIASARWKPVSSTTRPASGGRDEREQVGQHVLEGALDVEAGRSARPRTHTASRLTTMPATAVTRTAPPPDRGRVDQPDHRLVDDPDREQQQRQPVGLRGEDLGPLQPEREPARRRPGREAGSRTAPGRSRAASDSMCAASESRARESTSKPTVDLDRHEADDQRQRDSQQSPVGVRRCTPSSTRRKAPSPHRASCRPARA